MKRKILYMILFLVMITATIAGCESSGESEDETGIKLYFLDEDGTKLKTVNYKLESESVEEQVRELFLELKEEKDGCISAIPEMIKSMTYDISGNLLNLYFDATYANLDSIQEIFARASFVLTFVQLDKIDYVNIFVNNNPLKDANGDTVGMMSGDEFIDKVGNTINNYKNTTVTLYYANVSGSKLKTEVRSGKYDSSEPLEKYVVEQLIKGPSQEGSYRTIPQDTIILSINTNNGICYVDFSREFSKGATSVKDEILVYSIVNSLTELSHINKVQISVEGDIDVNLHGRLSLNQVFKKDLSYMEK